MTEKNKIFWEDGLPLLPEHFLKTDYYHEAFALGCLKHSSPFLWGVARAEPDHEMLCLGQYALARFSGIIPNIGPVDFPGTADAPKPIVIPEAARNVPVYLCAAGSGSEDYVPRKTDADDGGLRIGPYRMGMETIRGSSGREIEVAVLRPNLWYALGDAETGNPPAGVVAIRLDRIREVKANRTVDLDQTHVPPTVRYGASPILIRLINEILGLLRQRGGDISQRLDREIAPEDLSSVLLLATINEFEPEFAHLKKHPETHPERFFSAASRLAGRLATFAPPRRLEDMPVYSHDDPGPGFDLLMTAIRGSYHPVSAVNRLALKECGYGIYMTPLHDLDPVKAKRPRVFLSASAEMPRKRLEARLLASMKIGPCETLNRLVNDRLPGLAFRALEAAPAGIPDLRNQTFFELDPRSKLYGELSPEGIGVHVSETIPSLALAIWAFPNTDTASPDGDRAIRP